ncbi:MAG TPA: imidazole glycerol phosphate synthase subunit HisH [Planctomicrobium sp.]|nr:imidazole glycerol phosphate synthase subunit HisH [Planctomicrobium sp.]
MIGIIDYGMGNLRSVEKALEHLQVPVSIITSPKELSHCDGLILPGVGAFRDAIAELRRKDFVSPLLEVVASGKQLLGICLGQQLLFERSYEDGEYEGLGLIAGEVVRFHPEPELKIPHMGWNAIEIVRPHALVNGVNSGDYVYFVHSYHVSPKDDDVIVATTQHGSQKFAAIVNQNNVTAAQFHPEKSQKVGLKMLQNFADSVLGTASNSR